MSEAARETLRVRRQPPAFRQVGVRRLDYLTPHLAGLTLTGRDLEGFAVEQPAASVRLLLPLPGNTDLVIPAWNGNEFLLADGSRPIIRTFTPRRFDPDTLELDLEIVIHPGGTVSGWVQTAGPGDPAAISGPGRGYAVDAGAGSFLLAGDETAVPAISQLLEVLPADRPVQVHIEVTHPDARLKLPGHPRADVAWYDLSPDGRPGDALVPAIRAADLDPDVRVWVAGEAAAMHRTRRHLFEDRQLPRDQVTVRGYWKHAR